MTTPTTNDLTNMNMTKLNRDQVQALLKTAQIPAELIPGLRERLREMQRPRRAL